VPSAARMDNYHGLVDVPGTIGENKTSFISVQTSRDHVM